MGCLTDSDKCRHIFSCVIVLRKYWVVWETLGNSGKYDRQQRILGFVIHIGEIWVIWQTLERSELCNRHRRSIVWQTDRWKKLLEFDVPLMWNIIINFTHPINFDLGLIRTINSIFLEEYPKSDLCLPDMAQKFNKPDRATRCVICVI